MTPGEVRAMTVGEYRAFSAFAATVAKAQREATRG